MPQYGQLGLITATVSSALQTGAQAYTWCLWDQTWQTTREPFLPVVFNRDTLDFSVKTTDAFGRVSEVTGTGDCELIPRILAKEYASSRPFFPSQFTATVSAVANDTLAFLWVDAGGEQGSTRTFSMQLYGENYVDANVSIDGAIESAKSAVRYTYDSIENAAPLTSGIEWGVGLPGLTDLRFSVQLQATNSISWLGGHPVIGANPVAQSWALVGSTWSPVGKVSMLISGQSLAAQNGVYYSNSAELPYAGRSGSGFASGYVTIGANLDVLYVSQYDLDGNSSRACLEANLVYGSSICLKVQGKNSIFAISSVSWSSLGATCVVEPIGTIDYGSGSIRGTLSFSWSKEPVTWETGDLVAILGSTPYLVSVCVLDVLGQGIEATVVEDFSAAVAPGVSGWAVSAFSDRSGSYVWSSCALDQLSTVSAVGAPSTSVGVSRVRWSTSDLLPGPADFSQLVYDSDPDPHFISVTSNPRGQLPIQQFADVVMPQLEPTEETAYLATLIGAFGPTSTFVSSTSATTTAIDTASTGTDEATSQSLADFEDGDPLTGAAIQLAAGATAVLVTEANYVNIFAMAASSNYAGRFELLIGGSVVATLNISSSRTDDIHVFSTALENTGTMTLQVTNTGNTAGSYFGTVSVKL